MDRRWAQNSFDLDYINTPMAREMERRPFDIVCLTPDWSPEMFGMMCSGTFDFSSRLYGTMCSDHMD